MVDELDDDIDIEYEVNGQTGTLKSLRNDEDELLTLARTVLKSISKDGKLLLSSVVGNS